VKANACERLHSKQGRCPAASAVTSPVFESEPAADPLLRSIAAIAERAVLAVNASAAIAHEQAALAIRNELSEWRDARLQRHPHL
jgi:hypothetical protein